MRFCYLFLFLFFCLEDVFSAEQELLLTIDFPQTYDYVPNFDDSLLLSIGDWRGKRLLLVGSGDSVLLDSSSDTNLQLHRSESLRLARSRAAWVRMRLMSLGFDIGSLHLGVLTGSLDASVTWGGYVKIYGILD